MSTLSTRCCTIFIFPQRVVRKLTEIDVLTVGIPSGDFIPSVIKYQFSSKDKEKTIFEFFYLTVTISRQQAATDEPFSKELLTK